MTKSFNSLGFAKAPAETRVVVAMSGGVDSSVVAALLKEEGYDVVGVTLQLYDHGVALAKKGACCAGQDIYDARRVAERIGIPHFVLDYETKFSDAVMQEFADSYLKGETPIPCVRCNQRVKFRDLLAQARDLGGDCLATGHYVRRVMGAQGAELHRGTDPNRDQSYFLFATTQEQLDYLRFPLGHLPKAETRALAERFGLEVAAKPDSQDICFVPNGNYVSVVERLRPGAAAPGEIVHVDGRVLGKHQGIIHYTIGQRRGIGVNEKGTNNEPLYVVRLDTARRQVIVGPKSALARNLVHLREVNWLGGAIPATGELISVKLRSMSAPAAGRVLLGSDGTARVLLAEAQFGVAPGQAAAFYQGDRVLGGGWIAATECLASEGEVGQAATAA
ncbi:tRNA (5-methylaminomethyl-2-thiouridylate)-methyltransferase [Dongia mobilis]|uniref:tRNA-specific 2-thiouridylase MnmA n=1 Tax=Dongia mobilis TaxID=578943 RepID=A0A4R6WR15_9PROT|nr:tRNA 2-thiouridine(34) synthase MnmA [Dongia mobilis]TDQ80864.1 tRNA (5-methylaminomethyl-2-thiouridylate)-methyltransferase [Dongia mobilis]